MDPALRYRGLRLRVKSGEATGTKEAENAELLIEPVNNFASRDG